MEPKPSVSSFLPTFSVVRRTAGKLQMNMKWRTVNGKASRAAIWMQKSCCFRKRGGDRLEELPGSVAESCQVAWENNQPDTQRIQKWTPLLQMHSAVTQGTQSPKPERWMWGGLSFYPLIVSLSPRYGPGFWTFPRLCCPRVSEWGEWVMTKGPGWHQQLPLVEAVHGLWPL